jgi:hypothetical protein
MDQLSSRGSPASQALAGRLRRQFTKDAVPLRQDLADTLGVADDGEHDSWSSGDTLYKQVARAKARWLRRVMYGSVAGSSEKCFAYAIADHLNCVTLDAWPAQSRLAQYLGFKSVKTIQRAANALEALDMLVVRWTSKNQCRYAPVFLPSDEDRNVPSAGQTSPSQKDKDVCQSLLPIHLNSSDPSRGLSDKSDNVERRELRYRRSQRGGIEVKIAAMLGDDGMEVLSRLGAIDDSIIERLCRAHAVGALAQRELIAARLAAQQVRWSR